MKQLLVITALGFGFATSAFSATSTASEQAAINKLTQQINAQAATFNKALSEQQAQTQKTISQLQKEMQSQITNLQSEMQKMQAQLTNEIKEVQAEMVKNAGGTEPTKPTSAPATKK